MWFILNLLAIRFFGSIICRYYDPLINYPPWMLPYRFDCFIKNFEDIFMRRHGLNDLDFDPQFKDVWEVNKNCHNSHIESRTLDDLLKIYPRSFKEQTRPQANGHPYQEVQLLSN